MPNINFQTIHQMGGAINSFVKQATGRDAVQNIDMENITVAQNHYYEDVDISGRVVSFNAGAAGIPLEKCLVQIEPVQEGTGDPTPDNVRPISGWTGAKVTRTGKNLLNLSEWESESNSGITIGTDNIRVTNKGYQETLNRYNVLNRLACVFSFHVKTVSLDDSRSMFAVYADGVKRSGSGTTTIGNIELNSVGTEKDITIIVPDGTEYISFGGWAWGGEVQISNLQLSLGSTATAYEPYQGETYDITFPSEAGTVYGGTLDVTTGELVVDRAVYVPTGNEAGYTQQSNRIAFALPNAYHLPVPGSTERKCSDFIVVTSGTYCYVTTDMSVDELKSYFQQNTVQIVVGLATPIAYHLTPQEVRTLLGQNNIWADTGDIEVKFKKIKEVF